jgi:DNA-binding protein HU-beta
MRRRSQANLRLHLNKNVPAIRGAHGLFLNESLAFAGFWANSPRARRQRTVDSVAIEERIGQMTKNELIAMVADKAQMTKTAASAAVDATFDAITMTLKKGGEVKIMGFGNFRVVKRAAREGRDPRTGAPVKIKAARRPRFSAGKGLKEAVNK